MPHPLIVRDMYEPARTWPLEKIRLSDDTRRLMLRLLELRAPKDPDTPKAKLLMTRPQKEKALWLKISVWLEVSAAGQIVAAKGGRIAIAQDALAARRFIREEFIKEFPHMEIIPEQGGRPRVRPLKQEEAFGQLIAEAINSAYEVLARGTDATEEEINRTNLQETQQNITEHAKSSYRQTRRERTESR